MLKLGVIREQNFDAYSDGFYNYLEERSRWDTDYKYGDV